MVDVTVDNWATYGGVHYTAEYNAQVAADKLDRDCQQAYEDDKNKKAGIFSLAIGTLLIPKYKETYEESARRMREVATRQQAISLRLKDHYLDVNHPQKVKALEEAMNMPMPELSVVCEDYKAKSDKLVSRAREFTEQMSKRYGACDTYGCDNELDVYGAMAMADSTYARSHFNKRRYDQRVQLKRQVVQRAHAATLQSAGNVFQLLDGAGQIYSNIYSNAQTQLTGAVSQLGYGIGTMGLWGK